MNKPHIRELSVLEYRELYKKSFMKRVAFISAAKAPEKRQYRRNLVWLDSMPLSTPNVNSENPDDEPEDYGFVISDDGAGAEKIRTHILPNSGKSSERLRPLFTGLS